MISLFLICARGAESTKTQRFNPVAQMRDASPVNFHSFSSTRSAYSDELVNCVCDDHLVRRTFGAKSSLQSVELVSFNPLRSLRFDWPMH